MRTHLYKHKKKTEKKKPPALVLISLPSIVYAPLPSQRSNYAFEHESLIYAFHLE